VKLARRNEIVETPYGAIRVKVIQGHGSQDEEYRPEYEDCKQIAQREGIPLRKVYEVVTRVLQSGKDKKQLPQRERSRASHLSSE
jgi:hypothetical protein